MKLRLILATALAVLLIVPVAGSAAAGGKPIDRLVAEHGKALADCDADALVAGYTADATLFFPDGVIVKGRAALQDLYDGFVKPPEQKGLCGLVAKPVKSWTSGRTTFVKFRVTAPFLAKPYFSTDGYVFAGNKIAAEVSTFDATKLTFDK
jgi:hypothetical protein